MLQVLAVVPHVPPEVALQDIMRTHSVQLTIDNVLEGRLVWDDEYAPAPAPVLAVPPPVEPAINPPTRPEATPTWRTETASFAEARVDLPAQSRAIPSRHKAKMHTRAEFEELKRQMYAEGRR